MRLGHCAVVWLAVACARANNATTDIQTNDAPASHDATAEHDASTSHDASVHFDAALPKDAAPIDASVMVDAPPGSGGEPCLVNSNCNDPGTCCYFFVCTLGAGVGSNLCFPDS